MPLRVVLNNSRLHALYTPLKKWLIILGFPTGWPEADSAPTLALRFLLLVGQKMQVHSALELVDLRFI
jgi:hypothetical protein